MKVYINSSLNGPYGSLGRGWHESALVAERENSTDREVSSYFTSLISCGMAVLPADSPAEQAVAPAPEKPATKKKK